MDVYIYFYSKLRGTLGAFEDRLAEMVRPWARVSGSGTGIEGSNVDLEILDSSLSVETVLGRVREALLRLGAPANTVIDLNGTEHRLS